MADMRQMQIGHIVDFCVDYNRRQEESIKAEEEAEKRPGRMRRATQEEINAYFG